MIVNAIKRSIVVRLLVDLKVTVVCLLLLFLLTLLGTIHQVDNGIYAAQKRYFESFFVLVAGFFPLPGAQLVLWVLFVNLLSATIFRFVYRIKRIGILIIHGGVFILFFGMFFTQYFAQESFLSLLEGEGRNTTTDYFDWEVAVWNSRSQTREISAINVGPLGEGKSITIPTYGIKLVPQRYFKNARAFRRAGNDPILSANGSGISNIEEARASPDPKENFPGLLIEVQHQSGVSSSVLLYGGDIAPAVISTGKEFLALELRRIRYPMPFILSLDDFRVQFYPNSDIPRSFESDVMLQTPKLTRRVRISMNHPLRYSGYTFYQASYAIDGTGQETSTLAVVHNRSRIVPYVGTIVVGAGLMIHFVLTLVLRRTRRRRANRLAIRTE